ncbi:hypothetical protein MXB_1755 [Myxobolus squamalis]|nr:hypothetical protein MXB_1755 [Myxobolus squamalis]
MDPNIERRLFFQG